LDLIKPAFNNLSCLLLSRPAGEKVSNHEFRQIGAQLKVLHEEVLNEWYGLPSNPDEWSNCISWGDCFTLLIEQAIDTASSLSLKEPILAEEDVADLRRLLSRAIAYYVFDDVEVPSLVWCPSLNWKRFISAGEALEGGSKALCFSGWEGAIWGDPLLEGVFANPTQELMESYGGELITLPWHKTKRLWYTVYTALTDLIELAQAGEEFEVTMTEDELRQILAGAIAGLKAT
jgi:hypothetical protein